MSNNALTMENGKIEGSGVLQNLENKLLDLRPDVSQESRSCHICIEKSRRKGTVE